MLRTVVLFLGVIAVIAAPSAAFAQEDGHFHARRASIMEALPNGILLVHARPDIKDYRESGFHQDLNFVYFSGLAGVTNAILAIDGRAKESWLFVPTGVAGLHAMVGTTLQPGKQVAQTTGIDHVVDWNLFESFIDERAGAILYVPGALDGEPSNPAGMAPMNGNDVLWAASLRQRWPNASIESAAELVNRMRSLKDESEIAALRRSGAASAIALKAGLAAIRPGVMQRSAEAAVIAGCLNAGADGIGFWPWIMSGANGVFPTPFKSFGDYRHLNQEMAAGDLVRVDIGCEADHYQGDVGRTAPVSGVFSPGQREAWELLVIAYHAGLSVIKHGVAWTDVEAAARESVRTLAADPDHAPKTALGKEAAEILLSTDRVEWHYHGIGLWASEPYEPVLRAGMVIDFEPMFALEGQGYYLEDMILVTPDGHEILTPGLPYTADEIETAMRRH